MKKIVLLSIALTAVSAPAMADGFKYGWMTGHLPGTEIVAANVVREPAFIGKKEEQAQALDKAKEALESDYCKEAKSEFIVDPGLVVFDQGVGEWMVGGVCR